MEPLLGEKRGYGRSASNNNNNLSSLRRHRLLSYILGLVGGLALLLSARSVLNRINDRQHIFDITLRTKQEAFVESKTPQKVFDWSEDTFLPRRESPLEWINGSLAHYRGYERNAAPSKEHTISVYPRQAVISGLPDNVKAEEIVFGFTSPYLRVRDMCATWKHFLKSGAQCVIALPKDQVMFVRDLKYYLEKEGLEHCHVEAVDLGKYERYEQRVMNMPRLMHNTVYTDKNGQEVKPKWFVVADDDTQVLDIGLLQREMSKRPHTQDHFVCALTESSNQMARHGKICYGGGGILISAAFVKKMSDRMDECFWWHHWLFGGDEMLTHCASTATANATGSIPPDKVMEHIDALHQIDIPGDGTGFLQSGLPFITIHHYTGWLELFPHWSSPDRIEGLHRLQKAADFLGGDNLFKRFIFDDGATLLTLGYSITLYSKPLRPYELQLIERTHRWWEHTLRWPSRPGVAEGKAKGRWKTTYYLIDVLSEKNMLIYENQHKDLIRIKLTF